MINDTSFAAFNAAWIMKCLAYKAVEEEPELPGEMPDELWQAFQAVRDDRQKLGEYLRVLVRGTKRGIAERIMEL